MPGWLRRAAAWASRRTRSRSRPASIALTATSRSRRRPRRGRRRRSRRCRARSIRKRLRTTEPSTLLRLRRREPQACPAAQEWHRSAAGLRGRVPRSVHTCRRADCPGGSPWILRRGPSASSTSEQALPRRAPRERRPPKATAPADHGEAGDRARRGAARPDPPRARRPRLPRRPQGPGADGLRPRRLPDRRRDRPDQRALLRPPRGPGERLGDRLRHRDQRRPQRDGRLPTAGRGPRRAGRHGQRPGRPRARLRSCGPLPSARSPTG